MTLTQRRRALMAQSVNLPPVPSGYITDGLVFFLDGKQLVSATKWIDIVGGNVFNLIDCNPVNNGVAFNGSTSHGKHDGPITNDWENETIEVVLSDCASGINTKTILSPPVIDGNVGIGMRFGQESGAWNSRIATALIGNQHTFYFGTLGVRNRISASSTKDQSGLCVINGNAITASNATSYTSNTSGITCIGGRLTSSTTVYNFFVGTINAIRIYNRKLTLDEMQANQAKDLTYYNL